MDLAAEHLDQAVAAAQRTLCHCLNVSEHEVREAIAEHQPQTIRAVSQACGAGAGCMSCHRHIRRLLNEQVMQRRNQVLSESPASACSTATCH